MATCTTFLALAEQPYKAVDAPCDVVFLERESENEVGGGAI